MNAMRTANLLLRLDRQRCLMHRLAEKHQDLRHPAVQLASRKLDKLIIEVQKSDKELFENRRVGTQEGINRRE
jgi:hypothetical protein